MIPRDNGNRAVAELRLFFCFAVFALLGSATSIRVPQAFMSTAYGVTFISTGAMLADRFGQSAVLLPNGQVLIVGGYQWRVPPDAPIGRNTCELYDPTTAAFISAGSMNTARVEPKALFLPNSKILVASRDQGAELYDLATGAFRLSSAPITPVSGAATFGDGRVVLSGATCESCAPLSLSIYDGTTDRLTVGKSIGAGRSYGTATLLTNGKVLVAGGYTYNFNNGNYTQTYLSSAELIDPATGSVDATGSMLRPRAYHTATLLSNGKVLITGGGGGGPIITSAEIYDPAIGTFGSSSSNLRVPRFLHTATSLPNGKVLIAGGDTGNGNPTATAELYDPGTDTFSLIGSMSQARAFHSATLLLDGRVLMAGGYTRIGNQTPGISSAELFVADVVPCSFTLSSASQSFDASGGSGTVTVAASEGCSWGAKSSDSWINISFGVGGSGPGTVRYSVAANTGTKSRSGSITVSNQTVTITQAAVDIRRPNITSAGIAGKNLVVTGDNFDSGAVILLNGEQQKTLHDEQDLHSLTGKKVGKRIAPGETVKLQVRNSDSALSSDFSFTRP